MVCSSLLNIIYTLYALTCIDVMLYCTDPTTRVARRLYIGNLQGHVTDDEVRQGWDGMINVLCEIENECISTNIVVYGADVQTY